MGQGEPGVRRGVRIVLVYALWLLSAALSLWTMLWLRVFLLVDVPMALRGISPWALSAIDKFGLFLFGVVWLIFLVVSETRFNKMIGGDLSTRYVIRVFVAEGLLLGLAYGGHLLLN